MNELLDIGCPVIDKTPPRTLVITGTFTPFKIGENKYTLKDFLELIRNY